MPVSPGKGASPLVGPVMALAAMWCLVSAAVVVFLGDAESSSVGDLVRIPPRSRGSASLEVVARLPDGTTCVIGVGALADAAGGSLFVVGTGPGNAVSVLWGGTGRSGARGRDCANGTKLALKAIDMSEIKAAITGFGESATPW